MRRNGDGGLAIAEGVVIEVAILVGSPLGAAGAIVGKMDSGVDSAAA